MGLNAKNCKSYYFTLIFGFNFVQYLKNILANLKRTKIIITNHWMIWCFSNILLSFVKYYVVILANIFIFPTIKCFLETMCLWSTVLTAWYLAHLKLLITCLASIFDQMPSFLRTQLLILCWISCWISIMRIVCL